MAMQARQPAVPSQKGIVHIRTQGSFGGDEVQMTSRGCFLRDRNREISCCNCFVVRFEDIKATSCVTTVEGLDEKLKHDVILADLKKMLRCDGGITRKEGAGVVIRLNTDRTNAVKEFLWKSGLAAKDKISCTPCI
ncbi:hypothetical protein ACJRO7_025313 [Eucalyptus globulus]|uniref:SUI1 domain-containing protein n=1 Tax=Eucalyptus globulus TaxID=34317 RepID=A0ABD3KD36_EUCGL